MGPPPGASPPDAHDCIMVRIKRSYRIQVCRKTRFHGELPSDPPQTGTDQTPKLMQTLRVILAPRAQASRRCETQAPLRRHAAKLCYRFGPLTPSARSANLIAGDGMKNGFPGRVEDWRASWPRHPDRATFPAPSTSHAACGFPALRAPICFTSGLMGPIIPGQLSVRRVALDSC